MLLDYLCQSFVRELHPSRNLPIHYFFLVSIHIKETTMMSTVKPSKRPRKNTEDDATRKIYITSNPCITDPRELQTILNLSLRNLYGSLEAYSMDLTIQSTTTTDEKKAPDHRHANVLIISCPKQSVPYIRAALVLSTLPPYMASTLYRIDTFLEDERVVD